MDMATTANDDSGTAADTLWLVGREVYILIETGRGYSRVGWCAFQSTAEECRRDFLVPHPVSD